MQIWYELEQAGQPGLTFDEIIEKVRPRVPAGYAWRRYVRDKANHRRSDAKTSSEITTAHLISDEVSDTPANRQRAVHYVVRQTLQNMQRGNAMVLKRPDGHFAALRKPKIRGFTDEQYDFDGSVTRKHVALMDLLRIWRARVAEIDSQWIPTHHAGDMPTLRVADYAVIKRFVEAHPQQQ
jgi:hypothetical protein